MYNNRFMWKTARIYIAGCVLACTLAGCGQTEEVSDGGETGHTTEEYTIESSYNAMENEAEESGFFAGITPSEYIHFDQDYRTLHISREELYISEEDVQAEIDSFILEHKVLEEIPGREAMFGDTVILDFTGESNGTFLYDEKNYSLNLGMGTMPSEFEDALEGAQAGDEILLDLEYPQDYEDEMLQGQKIHFEIQVHNVYMVSIPDYTDSLIADYTEFRTVEEYETAVRKQLETEAKTNVISYWISEHAIMDTYPEALKEVYEKRLLQSLKLVAEQEYHMDSKQFLAQMGFASEREFLDTNSGSVLEELKSDLSYGCIAERENIVFSEKTYQQYAEDFALENGYESLDELYEFLDKHTVHMNFLRELTMEKLMEYVKFE